MDQLGFFFSPSTRAAVSVFYSRCFNQVFVGVLRYYPKLNDTSVAVRVCVCARVCLIPLRKPSKDEPKRIMHSEISSRSVSMCVCFLETARFELDEPMHTERMNDRSARW